MIRRPYGCGRWEGHDERLAAVLEERMGNGFADAEDGDVGGPGFYSMIRRSGKGRGGIIVHVGNEGFHSVGTYATDEELNSAWAEVETFCAEFYDDVEVE